MQKQKTTHIFISYRWIHSSYEIAKNLKHSIESRFKNVSVFRDEDKVRAGESLTDRIIEELDKSSLVLALLHKDWQREPPKSSGSYQNKLFNADDWVRMELDYTRNKRHLKVVPVLCNGATLPPRMDKSELNSVLPKELHFLSDDILAKEWNQSNDCEESLLQFLKEELKLVASADNIKQPPVNRLEEEDLLLPNILPNPKEVPVPYLGLPYYEEKHARVFFGRSDDIYNLWLKLEHTPKQLLLLYGYSGVGKSSLLQAGFFPRIKHKGWTVGYERRQKDKSLKSLLEELLLQVPTTGNTLLAIDQLEEALIDPLNGEEELPAFFDQIKMALPSCPNVKLLLGFREEFLPEIQEQVHKGLSENTTDYFLKPLDDTGIREAIALDEGIKKHYAFSMSEDLVNEIAANIIERGVQLHSGEVSSKAPWLQLLLRNLWQAAEKEAEEKGQRDFGILELTLQQLDLVRRDTFPLLVENQLSKMEAQPSPHRELYQNGLTLDLLNYLTTSGSTAAIRADDDLQQRYYLKPQELTAHLSLLENLQLVIRISNRKERKFTRLAHDSLAPIIRQRFEQSHLPTQRGHRIFASKKQVDKDGGFTMGLIQDKDDIAILDQAKYFMCQWSEAEQTAFEDGKKAIAKAEAELRDKTAFIFETLASDAIRLIQSLDHQEALPKFEAALGVDVPLEEKRGRLQQGLEELLCFFVHTGNHYQQAHHAAKLLLTFDPDETSRALIGKCQNEAWRRKKDFTPFSTTSVISTWQNLRSATCPL